MQSPPFPRYLVSPRSKYFPQHHVLKHPQLPFLPQCQRPSFTPIQNNTPTVQISSSAPSTNVVPPLSDFGLHDQNYAIYCKNTVVKSVHFMCDMTSSRWWPGRIVMPPSSLVGSSVRMYQNARCHSPHPRQVSRSNASERNTPAVNIHKTEFSRVLWKPHVPSVLKSKFASFCPTL